MKAVPLLPLIAVALPALAPAQKPSDWRKLNLTPMEFAKRLDQAFYNLKGAYGEASYQCRFFDGSQGQAVFVNRIRDRKNYRVEFVRVAEGGKDPFGSQMLIGRGGKATLMGLNVGTKPLKAGVDPGFIPKGKTLLAAWPQHFQQAMFMPYITGRGVFQPLIQSLVKGEGGYALRMDSRVMQGAAGTIPQARIYASRTPASAKKYGPASIEIVSDTKMWLPLQIRVHMTDLKGRKAFYEWSATWRGPVSYAEKWFEIPKN